MKITKEIKELKEKVKTLHEERLNSILSKLSLSGDKSQQELFEMFVEKVFDTFENLEEMILYFITKDMAVMFDSQVSDKERDKIYNKTNEAISKLKAIKSVEDLKDFSDLNNF